MAVDASIPLQINPNATAGPDQGKLMTLAAMAQEMKLKEVAVAKQNSLAQIMSNPQSTGPDGAFTPQAIQKIASVDPDMALKVREQTLSDHLAKVKEKALTDDALARKYELGIEGSRTAYEVYTANGGKPTANPNDPTEAMARSKAKAASDAWADGLGGQLMPDEVTALKARPFDPLMAKIGSEASPISQKKQTADLEAAAQTEKNREFGVSSGQRQQEIGIEKERLDQAKKNQAAADFDKPVAVEVTGADGKPKQVLAQQNTKTGQWVTADEKRSPLPSDGIRIVKGEATAGARESILVQRMLVDAKDATQEIKNIAELPIGSSTGFFGGRHQGSSLFEAAKETLTTKATSQEVQDYNTQAVGLGRALAGLETGGLQVNQGLMNQFEALQLKDGDTNLTKVRKLATMRQQADNALDTLVTNPRLGREQVEYAKNLRKDLAEAIPWSVHDVNELEKSGKPTQSLMDYAKTKDLPQKGKKENTTIPDGWAVKVQ